MADIDLKPSVIATGAKTSSVPDTVAGLCDAFAHLLSPFVEVVVHDWEKQEVCYLSGNISDRNLGDHSFIDPIDMPLAPGQIFGPYSKTNPDGRPVKSVSYIPPDHQRMLICINFDVSKFQSILSALTLLIEVAAPEEA
ncbi:MAG: PAS domain-containing protein, partial [Planctomycetota bacterium]